MTGRAAGKSVLFLAAVLAGVGGLACRQVEPLPVLTQLPEFALLERSGAALNLASFAGRPAIVDFIFTRCPASCPRLTAKMKELAQRIPAASKVRLLSISVDPDYDRPDVLTRYAEHWQVQGDRWWFATGDGDAVEKLIRGGFLLPVEATPANATSPILHSNRFALVDGHGRLRATYEAFEEHGLDRLLTDLARVEREP
ncbi:MAG: SCO family protein [Thermoanaerobaculia bacterium]